MTDRQTLNSLVILGALIGWCLVRTQVGYTRTRDGCATCAGRWDCGGCCDR